MQTVQPSMLGRSDTILGVCQALGEDFGISPNWLRVAFSIGVIFNVEYALGAYLAVGLLVLASRLLVPNRRDVSQPQRDRNVIAVEDSQPTAPAQAIPDKEKILIAA